MTFVKTLVLILAVTLSAPLVAQDKGSTNMEILRQKLMSEALAVEDAELQLKRSYQPKLAKVLPGAKAARYMQIENKIRAVVRYDLAASIPLVE